MGKLVEKLKQKYALVKNDKFLAMILILHLILVVCHVCHSFMSDIQYYAYARGCGCLVIAAFIFFFGRKGLSYGFTFYACGLIYINTFYNYGSIFLILVAIGANPIMKNRIFLLYLVNVVVSFSFQHLLVFSAAVHIVYILLFYLCIKYVFKVNAPETLNLTEDEKAILSELLSGKKQKEIELFSQPTITAKIKNARERNLCETTSDLLARYAIEIGEKSKIQNLNSL